MHIELHARAEDAGVEGHLRASIKLDGPCGTYLSGATVSFERAIPSWPVSGRVLSANVFLNCQGQPRLEGNLWGQGAFHSPAADEYFVLVLDPHVVVTRKP